jgi:hypothetical protein
MFELFLPIYFPACRELESAMIAAINGYENPIRLIISVGSPALCDIPFFLKKKKNTGSQ